MFSKSLLVIISLGALHATLAVATLSDAMPPIGMTIYHVDPDTGIEVPEYLGRFENATLRDEADNLLVQGPVERHTGSYVGPVCGKDKGFLESDYEIALAGAMNYFGDGKCFTKKYNYNYYTAVVFGCDYGRGQCFSGGRLSSDMQVVANTCPGLTGYYDDEPSKASYGRAINGQSFC